MAAGPFKVTDKFREALLKHQIDLVSGTFKHVLLDATHTFARTNGLLSNIVGDEVADADYARQALTGAAVAASGTKWCWTSDEADFGSVVDITAKFHAIVHQAGGSLTGTDIVVGMRDLNTDSPGTDPVSSDDGPFISRPHATDGWFYLPQPA
jgi:hypothetical protein